MWNEHEYMFTSSLVPPYMHGALIHYINLCHFKLVRAAFYIIILVRAANTLVPYNLYYIHKVPHPQGLKVSRSPSLSSTNQSSWGKCWRWTLVPVPLVLAVEKGDKKGARRLHSDSKWGPSRNLRILSLIVITEISSLSDNTIIYHLEPSPLNTTLCTYHLGWMQMRDGIYMYVECECWLWLLVCSYDYI